MIRTCYKTNTVLTIALFLLYSIVPISYGVANAMGYELVLKNDVAWAATILSVGGITTILMFIFTWKKVYKIGGLCACLSILMTLANWFVFGFIDTTAMIVVAFSFIFGVMIWIRFAWPMPLKVICAIIAVFAFPILTFFSATAFIFDANTEEIVQHTDSPSGNRYVEVVNEIKAEGSKYIVVNVYEKNADVDLGLMAFHKKPIQVKRNDVEKFEVIDAMWLDEHTLSVNGEVCKLE